MIHTLKQEEDLWFVAELYYGAAGLWDGIYYANREAIGDDPENVYPGMQITVPELETGERNLQTIEESME